MPDKGAGTVDTRQQRAGDGSTPKSGEGPPKGSIISATSEPRIRTDTEGNRIEKGKKNHHVRFIDEVKQGSPIEEVKEVRPFKNSQGGCGCSVM
mmetsp:Transcript_71740/g.214196  ORF Transcript_71740/g.214196 Transcript_71740/m.214196 type:complete len:94 (-) Transcript_71740:643-924(-)